MRDSVEGPGVLMLVAGPSGSGKDTLISVARRAFAGNPAFVFPMRLITRADRTGEEHIHVPVNEFERMRQDHLFFLDWDAHGLSYGIPASVRADLDEGRAVVFNVSRRMIPAARSKWRRTHVISVTVAADALRERLRARGRETEAEIEARICRATDDSCAAGEPLHVLDNSGALDHSSTRFLALLSRLSCLPAEAMPANGLENAATGRLA